MSTVEKDGLKALAPDLTKRFVAAKVIDRLLSGKEEALTSAALAQAIGVPIAHVEEALADTDALLSFEIAEPWEQVSSFRIKGLTIHLALVQPVLSAVTREGQSVPVDRRATGHDRIVLAGVEHRAAVLPIRNDDETLTGWFTLEVSRFFETEPGEDLAEVSSIRRDFESEDAAWQFWDDWCENVRALDDVLVWFDGLDAPLDENKKPLPILVDEATFYAVCKALDLDQVAPDGVISPEVADDRIEHECHLCAPNGEGRRWPGLDIAGPEPEAESTVELAGGRKIIVAHAVRYVPFAPTVDRFLFEDDETGETRVAFMLSASGWTMAEAATLAATLFKPKTFRIQVTTTGFRNEAKGKKPKVGEYDAVRDQDGTVSVVMPDGSLFALYPGEFELVQEPPMEEAS